MDQRDKGPKYMLMKCPTVTGITWSESRYVERQIITERTNGPWRSPHYNLEGMLAPEITVSVINIQSGGTPE